MLLAAEFYTFAGLREANVLYKYCANTAFSDLTDQNCLRNIQEMSFKLFKNLAIAAVLATGVTGCSDLANDPHNSAVGSAKVGKKSHRSVKFSSRGTDMAARTLIGGGSSSLSVFDGIWSSGNIWDRLRSDSKLPTGYENEPAVQAQIQWYMNHQDYLYNTVSRAAPYMYYIYEQTRQRNLPSELVLLPVIESEYNPFVRSSAGASGLWQLMPGTARGFGVRQNFWFDGRRDIYASTNAALDYLSYLQNYFGGDWLLAIAAYDTGEGNVQNAIRRNAVRDRGTSFWSLPLATETRSYVPRLLALAAIVRNPGKYGITLPTISDKPYFEQVDVGAPIKLNHAAQLADLSLSELKRLNPGYSRNTTDPTGHHKLILPIDKIATFKERLASLRTNGETLLASNDDESDVSKLSPIAVAHADAGADEGQTAKHMYTIKRGDTLGSIAKRYGVKSSDLQRWNKTKTKRLKPGTKLVVWSEYGESVAISDTKTSLKSDSQRAESIKQQMTVSKKSSSKSVKTVKTHSNKTATYTVHAGDSLVKIAEKYGASPGDLKRLNNLKSNSLQPGQRLILKG